MRMLTVMKAKPSRERKTIIKVKAFFGFCKDFDRFHINVDVIRQHLNITSVKFSLPR